MPELPDIHLYVTRLQERVVEKRLTDIKIYSPFVLRSVGVAPNSLVGKSVTNVSRLGKRLVFEFEDELYLIIHLMISGRLTWSNEPPKSVKPSKIELARFVWPNGTLTLQEASPKKRAGIWIVKGTAGLEAHKRGGLDVLESSLDAFTLRLQAENRTLKRALTDPNAFDGIGNAYSDEILFAAQLSPIKLTRSLKQEEIGRLYQACREVLTFWTNELQSVIPNFPKSSEVTAFRKDFNVHGRFKEACRVCQAPIQRIVGADNEMNYCARCQNDGKVLADRSLSRLLKDEWPKTIEELMGE